MSARITPASGAAGPPTTGPTDTAALDPRRWWALPVLLVGSFLSFLAGTGLLLTRVRRTPAVTGFPRSRWPPPWAPMPHAW